MDRITEVQEEDGVVTVLAPVPESVLLAEKASELKAGLGALGANLGALGASVGASLRARAAEPGAATAGGASLAAGTPLAAGAAGARMDPPVLAGYALLVAATAMLTFVSLQVPFLGDQELTLLALTGMAERVGSSARVLLYAAWLSALVPLLWKDRRAWLALLAPLLALLVMLWSVNGALSMPGGADAAAMAELLGDDALREMRRAAAEMFSFGLGMYASVLAALWLAALGARRFLGRA